MQAVLKPLSLDYLDEIMAWINNPEVTSRFAWFRPNVTRDEEKKFIQSQMASKKDRAFAIETEEGKYLGDISLHEIDWNAKKARMSILIADKEQRGKGYGESAIKKLLSVAFNEMKLHKVWLVVFEENENARGLYRKCGFQEEGILKDEYFVKGKYHNMVRMAIIQRRLK